MLVVGYGVIIFLPSPPNYVIRSPGAHILLVPNLTELSFLFPHSGIEWKTILKQKLLEPLHSTAIQSRPNVLQAPRGKTKKCLIFPSYFHFIYLFYFNRFTNLILNQHTLKHTHTHTENKDLNDTIPTGTPRQLAPITAGPEHIK